MDTHAHEGISTLESSQFRFQRAAFLAGQIALGYEVDVRSSDEQEAFIFEARPYQLDVWKSLADVRAQGGDSALVHLATGLGKTTVAVIDALIFADYFQKQHARLPRILFACHQNEILDQAGERFQLFARGISQGRLTRSTLSEQNPITLASMQALHKNLDALSPDTFDYIVYDEAHHTQAETFKEVVNHFRPQFQLALTATPDRMDEADIRDLFGKEIYSKSLVESMAEGLLADVDYHIIFDDVVKQAIAAGFKPKSVKEIRQLLENGSRNEAIAEQIMRRKTEMGLPDAKTIVFCESLPQADEMAALLNGQAYHSEISEDERKETLRRFRTNGLTTITARDMFNEGVDIPDARIIIFLRSTASKIVFEQQLGRGLRKHEGKEKVTVLDFVANIERMEYLREFASELKKRIPKTAEGTGEGCDIHGPFSVSDGHTEFDFDSVSVILLEKLASLQGLRGSTMDDLVDIWRAEFPGVKPDKNTITEANKLGKFVSVSNVAVKGGVQELQRLLGYEVTDYTELTIADLADSWRNNYPDLKPTMDLLRVASKEGNMPSTTVIARLGGITPLLLELGYDAVARQKKVESLEEAAELWRLQFADTYPTQRLIKELSKKGQFSSAHQIESMGGLTRFRELLGFEVFKPQSIEEITAKWQELYPGIKPTSKLIEEASKDGKFISERIIGKFGGVMALQRDLGYEVLRKVALKLESMEEAVQRWRQEFPGIIPSVKEVNAAYRSGKFVSMDSLRDLGGITEMKRLYFDNDDTKQDG